MIEHFNSASTSHRISGCDRHELGLAYEARLNPLAGGINKYSNDRKGYYNRSRSASIGGRAVQVMAEDMAESRINARIETGANGFKRQETESAGAGCAGQGRRYRVQSGDELGHNENRSSIPGKGLFRSTIMGVRVSREAVNEVQNLVSPAPTRLIPHPVGQHTGSDGQTERGDEAQLPGGCERPGSKQKQRSRYRQTYLVREHRSEQD